MIKRRDLYTVKKLIVFIMLTSALIISLVAVMVIRSNSENRVRPITTPGGSPQPVGVVATPRVPSHPSAQDVKTFTETNPLLYRSTYTTLDPYEKVLEFYAQNLTAQGWVSLNTGMYPTYEWKDNTGVLPYGLYLHILFTGRVGGGIDISIDLLPWPEADRTPIYPGAKQIEYKDGKDYDGDPVKTITFVVNAAPRDVESFYKSRLAEYGWKFHEEESSSVTTYARLVFRSLYRVGRVLSITATPDTQGNLKVELQFLEGPLPLNP